MAVSHLFSCLFFKNIKHKLKCDRICVILKKKYIFWREHAYTDR